MKDITFRDKLKELCEKRGMNLNDLAKVMSVTSSYFSMFGTVRGIAFNKLEKVIRFLDLDMNDANELRRLAKYAVMRKPLLVNDTFINIVASDIAFRDSSFLSAMLVRALNFAGVKAKIK